MIHITSKLGTLPHHHLTLYTAKDIQSVQDGDVAYFNNLCLKKFKLNQERFSRKTATLDGRTATLVIRTPFLQLKGVSQLEKFWKWLQKTMQILMLYGRPTISNQQWLRIKTKLFVFLIILFFLLNCLISKVFADFRHFEVRNRNIHN